MMDDNAPQRINDTRIRCVGCGYELSGAVVGGTCPECGKPIRDSLRLGVAQHATTTSANAIVGLILGCLGIVSSCLILSPFAIWLYYRTKEDVARGNASPDSMGIATAGLVLGWIGTALLILSCCVTGGWLALVIGLGFA